MLLPINNRSGTKWDMHKHIYISHIDGLGNYMYIMNVSVKSEISSYAAKLINYRRGQSFLQDVLQ